jgi:tRNA threonylcarbamoyladenosine biosynthesis protein TsaB
MLALALDTSTPVLSAALVEWREGELEVLATRQVGPPEITSTVVPGLFDELLAEAGRTISQLQVVVTGVGPGLFTGARVAVATMKAIAYARQLPLLGAGSLEAMALAAARSASLEKGDRLLAPPECGLLCPVIDARKGEVYSALYRFEGGRLVVVSEPRAGTPAALVEQLQSQSEPLKIFGTGVKPLRAVIPAESSWVLLDEAQTPAAAEIAWFALSRTPAPTFDAHEVLALEPTYLRPPEAEVALRRREAAKSNPTT